MLVGTYLVVTEFYNSGDWEFTGRDFQNQASPGALHVSKLFWTICSKGKVHLLNGNSEHILYAWRTYFFFKSCNYYGGGGGAVVAGEKNANEDLGKK